MMSGDLCQNKACFNYGKYWRLCGHANGKSARPKPVNPRSKKLEETMRQDYRPQVKEMVAAGEKCRVHSPECAKNATGFHHLSGRIGELLTNREKKIPCCDACNRYIEKNDAWARANGFKLSKFLEPAKNQKIVISPNKNVNQNISSNA